jgi:hypothetical protein
VIDIAISTQHVATARVDAVGEVGEVPAEEALDPPLLFEQLANDGDELSHGEVEAVIADVALHGAISTTGIRGGRNGPARAISRSRMAAKVFCRQNCVTGPIALDHGRLDRSIEIVHAR